MSLLHHGFDLVSCVFFVLFIWFFFFFKQKTAYEMRISDWSSDVCSSDLFIATGAGAASRIAVGTGVVGGMLAATGFGIFFIPVFYLSVRRWLSKRRPPAPGEERHSDQEPGHA